MLGVLAKITASYKRMDQNPSFSMSSSWTTLILLPKGQPREKQEAMETKRRKSSERSF